MKTILFLLGSLLCVLSGYSQEKPYYLKAAYKGGMIINPGLSLGISYPVWETSREKNNGKTMQREIRLGLVAGVYYHRRLNTGLNVGPSVEWLRTGPKGAQFGLSLEGGYLRALIPSAYEVGDSGAVRKAGSAGTDHFYLSPGLRLGKDLSRGKGTPLAWFVHPQLQFQTPYFGKTNKYFLTEIGINFKL